jgi:hypothetical protein
VINVSFVVFVVAGCIVQVLGVVVLFIAVFLCCACALCVMCVTCLLYYTIATGLKPNYSLANIYTYIHPIIYITLQKLIQCKKTPRHVI